MYDFKMTEVVPRPYLYVEKTCSMDPEDVGQAMGAAFGEVMAFVHAKGIKSAEKALSVYYDYAPDRLSFRAGYLVSQVDADKAEGAIKSDRTPGGNVLSYVYVGPYSGLRASYGEMMTYIAQIGREPGAPTWEIYVNDPSETPPEELRTEIFVTLAE